MTLLELWPIEIYLQQKTKAKDQNAVNIIVEGCEGGSVTMQM
jgi:hypothetical protein